jgi:hypothetical protein
MCGDQEMWSRTEYNKMVWNRVEHNGNIKDVVKCSSGGSRDRSTGDRERRVMAQGGRVTDVVEESCDRS